ncbi:ribosomal protein S6 kinase delta-1-like [Ptychodera flava]|uniref:ribosomal protein S6 kinase delta-1-like n=1 Tax=Ptychodera flava TaxID=63121 RepID=UPI00396A7BD8
MASKKDPTVRTFDISDPTKHEKGFTVYKVTYRVAPKSNPDNATEYIIWKRYNDFKKLYKVLRTLHFNLRRPEKFPEFARAKFFGRFDDQVIEERRQSALQLLEFAAEFQPIVNSKAFQQFFEGAEQVNSDRNMGLLPPPAIQPKQLMPPLAGVMAPPSIATDDSSTRASSQASSVENIAETAESEDVMGATLGGVWLHRQAQDDSISCSTDDDDHTTFTDDDSVPTTPLPQIKDLTIFDPFAPDKDPNETPILAQSKSWLFEAMDACAELEQKSQQSEHSSDDAGITMKCSKAESVPDDEIDSPPHDTESEPVSSTSGYSSAALTQESLAEHNRLDKERRPVSAARIYLDSIKAQSKGPRRSLNLSESDSDSRTNSPRKSLVNQVVVRDKERSSSEFSNESVSNMDLGGKEDYLFKAANQISAALENEANASYDAAFTYYKVGVNILLQGVVTDNNRSRREAVRRKTAQYLMKAEDIYNKHLSAEAANARRWETESIPIELDPGTAHLRGSLDEMKNFKVLGVVDRVMLVLDTMSYNTYVIKVLHKCSMPSQSRANRIPTSCPYMVQLHKYYETETSVYLVLEHATGGKLWVYASSYFHSEEEKVPLGSSLERSIGSRGSRRSRCNSSTSTGSKDLKITMDTAEDSDVFESPTKSLKSDSSQGVRSSQGVGSDGIDLELSEPLHAIPEHDQKGKDGKDSEASSISDPDLIAPSEPVSSYLDLFQDYSQQAEEPATSEADTGFTKGDSEAGIMDIKQLQDGSDTITENKEQVEFDIDFEDIDETPDPIMDLMKASSQYDNELFGDTNTAVPPSPEQQSLHNASSQGIDFSAVTGDIKEKEPSINLFSIDSIESPSEMNIPESPRVFSFSSDQGSGILTKNGDSPFMTTVTEEHEAEVPTEKEDDSHSNQGYKEKLSCPHTASTDETGAYRDEMDEHAVISDAMQVIKDIESFENADGHSSESEDVLSRDSTDQEKLKAKSVNNYNMGATVETEDSLLDNLTYLRDVDNDSSTVLPQDNCAKTSDAEVTHKDVKLLDSEGQSEADGKDLNITVNPFNVSNENLDLHSETSEITSGSQPAVTTMIRVKEDTEGHKASVNAVKDLPTPHTATPSTPVHAVNGTPRHDLSPDTERDPPRSSSPRPLGIGEGMVQGLKELISRASSSNLQTLITGKREGTGNSELTKDNRDLSTADRTLQTNKNMSVKSNAVSETSRDDVRKSEKPRKRSGSGDSFRSRSLSSLFTHLDIAAKSASHATLPESCVKMWAAEIIVALTRLHSMGILCRDLRPENILLGERGHIRLTYFSEWKWVEPSCDPTAVELMYSAPELCGIFKLTPACDWWSLGALLFEMLTGKALYMCHPSGINSHTQLNIPDHVSPEARSLLIQLLQFNINERLGAGMSGVEDIKSHPFFFGVDWNKLKG